MAANELPEKSIAAHWVLLKVALLPMASSLFCFEAITCSPVDRHANKSWALLQSQQSCKYCYALTSAFATKHANVTTVMRTCLM